MKKLQDLSLKITKTRRNMTITDLNFVCGACQSAYRSYPALYLHIKRKHGGVRPPNTKSSTKTTSSLSGSRTHTGRPQKPSLDVDGVTERQMQIERAQSDLLGFLGEKLEVVTLMASKPKLSNIVAEFLKASEQTDDDMLTQFKIQAQTLFQELKEGNAKEDEIELDFDDFYQIDNKNGLKILCWFLFWLGKYVIHLQALKDLIIIFSKIWKLIVQKQLEITDLDNKLIWNSVMKECEPCLEDLVCFKSKKEWVYEFVSKTSHLIGNAFEQQEA